VRPVFQPIVSLALGRVVAYEALSRPREGAGRDLPIFDVVESARRTGAEAEADLDTLCLRAIAEQAARLPEGVSLFVNVSPATLLDHPEALQPLADRASQVTLEVTERTDVPDARWEAFVHSVDLLRWRGFLVAMDDCGAGYSGLARLVALRPDYAKVDMELVRGVDHVSAKTQLVGALVAFARRAGIAVIAEGVETQAELDALCEIGVDYVQGYLLGRPAPSFETITIPVHPAKETAQADAAAALGASIRLARMASRGLGDAPGLYESIVHATREATGADLAVLRRRNGQSLTPVATSGVPEPQSPREIQIASTDPLAEAFRAGRLIVRQTHEEDWGLSPYGSAVVAPISVDGIPWGMLTAAFQAENRIRGVLVDLATGLADQAGLILAANQGGLVPSSTVIIDALRYLVNHPGDVSDILARVVKEVERVTGSHDCWIGRVQGERFNLVMSSGDQSSMDLAVWLDPESEMGRMPPGVALREARRVVVDDIRVEPSLVPQLDDLLASAIISAAAIPILYEGAVVGILKVYHSNTAAFTEDKLTFLEEIAGVLGIFLGRVVHQG